MESRSFIRYLKNRWLSCSACQPPLVGCTDEEIEALRIAQGVERLPALYVEFMRQMGRADGGLGTFFEADFSYAAVVKLKSPEIGYALAILRSLGQEEGSFVFLSDNANFLYTFNTSDPYDDPVIYNFHESSEIGEPYYVKAEVGNLAAFLVDCVEACLGASVEDD